MLSLLCAGKCYKYHDALHTLCIRFLVPFPYGRQSDCNAKMPKEVP